MSEPLIDNPKALDQYLDLLGDAGPAFVCTIIDNAIEGAAASFDELSTCITANDFNTFRRIAHSFKTRCSTVGANKLAGKFLTLEDAGAAGSIASVERILNECKTEFATLSMELVSKKVALS